MSSAIIDFFQNHPSMRNIDAIDLARVSSTAAIKEFEKDESVFEKDTPCSNVYFILEGKVALQQSGETSIEKGKNQFIGEEAAFVSDGYAFTAKALNGKVKLIEIPQNALDELMKKYDNLYSYFFNSYNQKLSKKNLSEAQGAADTPQQTERMSFKILMSWLVAFLVPMIVYTSLGSALTPEGKLFLSVLSAGVVLWIFNIFPDFVPALMILTSTLMMGLVPLKVILSGFSSNTFFLVLGITGLSILIGSSGLLYRGMLLLLRYLPAGSVWYNIGLFFIGALMTPVIPSIINRTKVIAPLTEDLITLLGIKKKEGAATKISASAFYGATLLSSIFLTGSIMNFVVMGFIPFKDQQFIESIGWIVASGVSGAILLIIHFVGSSIFFVSKEKVAVSKEKIDQQLKILGSLKPNEFAAIGTLVLFGLALFLTPYHKIPVYWLTLFLLFALLSLRIVTHKQWLTQTDWSFLIFLGCIVGISETLNYLQIDKLIAGALVPIIKSVLSADNITGILSLLVVLTIGIRMFLPIGPTVIIMMTLSFPLADTFGLSLWPFGFTIIMVCDIWFFPYQSPFYMSYANSFHRGSPYAEKKFLLYNALVNFGRIVAIYLSLPYWKSLGII
jgi:divalent anion:Na+ symporter, DASS family